MFDIPLLLSPQIKIVLGIQDKTVRIYHENNLEVDIIVNTKFV
jgi:hypothetical protein